MSSIAKIHWLYGGKAHNIKGCSFIVRFSNQDAIDLIERNLTNLGAFRIKLPNGKENRVSIKKDLTKAQKDEENLLNKARAILRKKDNLELKVRDDARGFYLRTANGQKHYADSKLVIDALKSAE